VDDCPSQRFEFHVFPGAAVHRIWNHENEIGFEGDGRHPGSLRLDVSKGKQVRLKQVTLVSFRREMRPSM
jgi:hypothetical protein